MDRVDIENYRSIKKVSLGFSPTCRILVGINESGKTNILDALVLLDPQQNPENEDLREFGPTEDPSAEAFVRFVFALDNDDRQAIYDNLATRVLGAHSGGAILQLGRKWLDLRQFCADRTEVLYRVDVRSKTSFLTGWMLPRGYVVSEEWRRPSDDCPDDVVVDPEQADSVPLKNFELVSTREAHDIDPTYLKKVEPEYVNDLFLTCMREVLSDDLPQCVYWKYDEAFLLPGKISITEFSNNPDSCVPLKHMFSLAKVKPVRSAITEAKARSNGLRNLLNRVARAGTRYLRQVWKDYPDIRIHLAENGTHIDAAIEDKYNLYNMDRRSDGFKRFISFLLLISAKVKTRELKNTLILYDEPDTSLHPSGARHLRDELVKIGRDNYVVYSTHSIFMIDRDQIDRHVIVRKKREITTVENVTESNIYDEEVLHNALGTSMFENLRRKNIVFEGWRDKKLFRVAIKAAPDAQSAIASTFDEVGLCHARGAKDVPRITPILELAERGCVIVSDGDEPAKREQRSYDGHGVWVRYDELVQGSEVVTAEDFVRVGAFAPILRRLESEHSGLGDLEPSELRNPLGALAKIAEWLRQASVPNDEIKKALNSVKVDLFDNLTGAQVEPLYYDFLTNLSAKVAQSES